MQTPKISYANRGTALEELIKMANVQYRRKGIALIHKIPSEWLPIRNSKGKIVSAKIEEKAAVDFIGRYRDIPIAFDAKSVAKGDRWYLRRLEEHQYRFLKDWETGRARSFILLGFWETEEFFLIPFKFILKKWSKWKKGGAASIKLTELREIFPVIKINKRGIILDYLSVIEINQPEKQDIAAVKGIKDQIIKAGIIKAN